jgi:LysM repeat protein
MARMKRGMMIASTLMLVSLTLSACNKAYSQAGASTFTPVPQSNLFASPQANTIDDVATFAAGTATAAVLTTSPGAPAASTATLAPGVTPLAVTATNTPLVSVNPTTTATLAVANSTPVNGGPTATQIPAGSVPASYTLQSGEFVYCIARRFNINPDDILALNGIVDSQTIYPGLTIKLPQTGNPFPGDRMLRNHPASYTVSTSDESVYSVACAFGDIDPARIAQANNISVGASLTPGQTLTIP